MWRIIIRHDWRLLRANRFALGLGLALVLLALLASINGLTRLSQRQALVARVTNTDQANITKSINDLEKIAINGNIFDGSHFQDPRSASAAAGNLAARFAIMPVSPLSVLAVGQSDIASYYYLVSTSKRQGLVHDAEIENAHLLFIGPFDWAFLLVYLLPLLIISFTYNIVSLEREQGTLPLILSGPVPLRYVTGVKILFRYLLVNLLLTLMLGVVVLLAGGALASAQFWLVIVSVWAYSAFWFGVSYLTNSLAHSSGYNAGVLVCTWLVATIILPALLNIIVQQLHPMPSRYTLITQNRAAADKARAEGNQLLSGFYEDHPELLPAGKSINYDDFGLKSFVINGQVRQALEPLQEQFKQTAQAQQALVSQYRFLSPAILFYESLNRLTGVSELHYDHFEQQVSDFQQRLLVYFQPKIFKMQAMTIADYKAVPQFRYKPLQTIAGIGLWSNLLWLGALSILLVVGAYYNLKNTSR